MAERISFKSFYYSLGTTSFRMQNFNKKIEMQLDLLNKFWNIKENMNKSWEGNELLQSSYYDFIKENDFLKVGDAPRKAKDARQKTSGMRDIGLIYNNRHLSPVGEELLKISKNHDFVSDNFLQIPKDSFIYFKQLLKTTLTIDESTIRPYVLLCRLLRKFSFLSKEEFTYLFPLCIDKNSTEFVESKLDKIRTINLIDETIVEIFMQRDNYKKALKLFVETNCLTEDIFCEIGLNRKSREYDRVYFYLFDSLKKVYFDSKNDPKEILKLYEFSNIPNVKTHWRKILFDTSSSSAIQKDPVLHLNTNMFTNCETEIQFKKIFFETMHLIKIKRTLEDYYDLNRRYLKITDTLLFADNQVKFDIIPKYFFSLLPDDFYDLAFESCNKLTESISLGEISPYLKIEEKKLLLEINKDNKTKLKNISEVQQFVANERNERFSRLIDERFTNEILIRILRLFQKRKGPVDDSEIQTLVTDEADGPTIFEYILAIIWYKISDRKGDVLSFMNLSLEADLLPKTHAGGGSADIIWKYEATSDYPQHDLLIEATLSDSINQRRMEMEPVSRHLGDYILSHKDYETYCVFITNYLHMNVIADFRNRKNAIYYSNDGENSINEMMITPLDTEVLISILKKNVKYEKLYRIFHEHFENNSLPKEWYKGLKETIC